MDTFRRFHFKKAGNLTASQHKQPKPTKNIFLRNSARVLTEKYFDGKNHRRLHNHYQSVRALKRSKAHHASSSHADRQFERNLFKRIN